MASVIANQFAITFFSTIVAPHQKENVIFSPLSISSALAVVAAGAEGKTLEEIAKGLSWGGEGKQLPKNMLTEMKKTVGECKGSCLLKSANGMWLARKFSVSEAFEKFLKEYDIKVSETDFQHDNVKSTSLINQWVSKQTNDRISNLFSSGQLDEATRAVMVNALYFKGSWLQPFDKKMTQSAAFHVSSTKAVNVEMMYHYGEFRYLYDSENKCDIARLDYASSAFNMVLVVPREIEGLKDVTSSLTVTKVSKWIDELASSSPEPVDIFLPRFKVSKRIDLKEYLMKLGIRQMFTNSANLSGITTTEELYVSSAVHQSFLEVNEEGTEAGAATGMGIANMSLPPQVQADRPFMFMITSSKTGGIIFIGSVVDPSAEKQA